MTSIQRAFLAVPGFIADLDQELLRKKYRLLGAWGDLRFAEGPGDEIVWAQNTWLAPELIEFSSITAAATALKDRGRNWAAYSHTLHRRAHLITEQLPKVPHKQIKFLAPPPKSPFGAFTLLEANKLIASPTTNHPYPLGIVEFLENKIEPPSRAYLKLWELFTLHGIQPKSGERCIDLGSSPGGWTWVLTELGADVLSVDKAPITEELLARKNVTYEKASAFSLEPSAVGKVDWLFSDVICYPERLWKLVERWLASGNAKNFVCTIKFQGKTDFAVMEQFAKIPHSRIVHLHHNKHEVTWFLKNPGA